MSVRSIVSSKPPRKNWSLKRGDIAGKKESKGKSSPMRRVVVGGLLACVLVLMLVGGRAVITSVNDWTKIQQTTIVGFEHLSRNEVFGLLNLEPDSSLWSIDTDQLTAQLEAHPWIRSVTFDRVFPHTLVVHIEERKPVAVLQSSKKGHFLDVEGYLLPGEQARSSKQLPVLEGLTLKAFTQHEDESHQRAKEGIRLAAMLSERFAGRPRVNVAHRRTTVVDFPRLRFQFGADAEQQWGRFLVLYPTLKSGIGRYTQEVDLRFSQKVILRKRTL